MVPELKPWVERTFVLELPDWRFPLELERLRSGPVSAEQLVSGLELDVLTTRIDGAWSIQEQLGHLIDLETLGMSRLDDFAAGKSVLSAADMTNARTNEREYNRASIRELLREFREARQRFTTRLEELSPGDQQRRALHPRVRQDMRPVDLMYFVAEHDNHHLARISSIIREATGH
ncbi:DinB family protein [candidate division KSB1 bacterium]|nr:DinB family protein [candidate division KSB1 bacterium]